MPQPSRYPPKTPNSNLKSFFSVQTKRLHESFDGWYSSLAQAAGELSLAEPAVSGRFMLFLQFLYFCAKWGFWAIISGYRYARRSIKGSKGVDDRLVSKKILSQKWLIGLAPKARYSWSKIQKHVLFVTSPREKPKPKSNIF